MKPSGMSKFTVRMIFLAVLAILPKSQTFAVPANPHAVTVKQPNLNAVRVFLRGDEHLHWHEDEQGYTILKEKAAGPWVYAMKDATGKLIASKKMVGETDPATLGVPKRLLPADAISAATSARARTARSPVGVAPKAAKTGTMKNLVLLVAFSDKAITYTTNEYNALFNTIGYTTDGAQGSMKDYYNEASYNQLNVDSVVVASVTLANGYAYYGANDTSGNDLRPQLMVQQALAALDARGFDFSTLDSDSDGWVDGLTVIHAGGGEEYGGNDENYIWSHQWDLTSPVTYDGKKLQTYHTEPARRGWDSDSSSQGITRIGVICHENGHFLGLPDLYDYGYDSEGVGEFCLMSGGSWNGDNGTQPAHMSAWCKTSLGWVSATTVTAAGTYTVPRGEDHQAIFRLSGAFPSTQYFLVENRQGYGFDASMPGSTRGLLIWHVDETQPDNDDQTHFMVDLEEASGTQHLQSTNSTGDDADYFRTGTMTTFTSSTTPNNRSYASVALGMDITAVSASGTSMTFTVSMNTPVSITGDPQSRTNNFGTSASFTVTATGTAPLYYQWQKNSANIGLATNATYTIAAVALGDAGNYRCKVSNVVNVATSGVASLTVYTAPAFNALGSQSATVGVAKAFTVSATGNPMPTLALQSQTASSGYSFSNATGVLTYTPPVADAGARTFTFTASNSYGVATQTVSVTVYGALPAAPATIWASATNTTDFTAMWSSVSGATDYRLDVATSNGFSSGGGAGVLIDEDFTAFSDWTDSGTANDTTHAGLSSPCRGLGIGDTLTSPTVNYPTQMTFFVDASAGGDGLTTTNYYSLNGGASWLPIGTFISTVAGATETQVLTSSPNLSGSTNVMFRFVSAYNTWYLDDVKVTGGSAGAPSYVPSYSNRTVAGTSQSATGLTAGAAYYFRVRAVNGGGTGTYSSVASVTTMVSATSPMFTGGAGPYSTTTGVALVFTVSASGVPAATLALQSTTASSGYSFVPETGALSYTPTSNDIGTRTFTFTASNVVGVVTQTTSVGVSVAAGTPPVVSAIGAQNATTYANFEYTVMATPTEGDPILYYACTSSVTESTWTFNTNSAHFLFVPTTNQVGANSFSFTATDKDGTSAPVTMSVTVTEGVSAAPASIWASATNMAGFTAAWSTVLGAVSYRLDVGTNATFSGTGGAGGQFLLASNAATSPSQITNNWSGYNLAGSTYVQMLQSSSVITSPPFSTVGFTNLTVDLRARTFNGTSKSNITVSISTNDGAAWTVMGIVCPPSGATFAAVPTLTHTANLGFSQTRIRWQTLDGTGSIGVGVSNLVVQGWSTGASAPIYIAGYSNQTVSGTSQSVTGLTASSTYYFRVRAVSGGGMSSNSTVANVTTASHTPAGTPPVVDAIPAQISAVGATFEYPVTATPTEGDPILSFACTSTVDVATWDFDPNSGYLLFYPTTIQLGTNLFTFTAMDKDGTSAPGVMTLRVNTAAATNAFEEWVAGDQGQDPGNSNFVENADYDGDGATTWAEYLADTDPSSSNSLLVLSGNYVIAATSNGTGQVRFTFPASTGRYYQLEYCTDLINHSVGTNNLGWGVPGMVITNDAAGTWYGVIRALLQAP